MIKRLSFVVAALALLLGACETYEPFEYHEIHEIPQGPGLFSGEDGEFVIIGGDDD